MSSSAPSSNTALPTVSSLTETVTSAETSPLLRIVATLIQPVECDAPSTSGERSVMVTLPCCSFTMATSQSAMVMLAEPLPFVTYFANVLPMKQQLRSVSAARTMSTLERMRFFSVFSILFFSLMYLQSGPLYGADRFYLVSSCFSSCAGAEAAAEASSAGAAAARRRAISSSFSLSCSLCACLTLRLCSVMRTIS